MTPSSSKLPYVANLASRVAILGTLLALLASCGGSPARKSADVASRDQPKTPLTPVETPPLEPPGLGAVAHDGLERTEEVLAPPLLFKWYREDGKVVERREGPVAVWETRLTLEQGQLLTFSLPAPPPAIFDVMVYNHRQIGQDGKPKGAPLRHLSCSPRSGRAGCALARMETGAGSFYEIRPEGMPEVFRGALRDRPGAPLYLALSASWPIALRSDREPRLYYNTVAWLVVVEQPKEALRKQLPP